ncbi:Uncharacterised protein [Chlamydia trachomatis]|nr:Uncharacterised protein [Chlamydia trachomatis]
MLSYQQGNIFGRTRHFDDVGVQTHAVESFASLSDTVVTASKNPTACATKNFVADLIHVADNDLRFKPGRTRQITTPVNADDNRRSIADPTLQVLQLLFGLGVVKDDDNGLSFEVLLKGRNTNTS